MDYKIGIDSAALTLNEAYLDGGSRDPHPEAGDVVGGNVYFLITSNDGLSAIVIDGTTYTIQAGGDHLGGLSPY